MGSSNSTTEYNSEWKSQSWCDCGASNFRAFKIMWRTHTMLSAAAEAGVNVARDVVAVATLGISTVYNGGIAEPLHHAVVVIYKCNECGGGEYWVTYELATRGKEASQGYYLYYRECVRSAEINLPYSTVHGVYETMADRYCPVNYNCITFASGFYERVLRAN